MSSPLRIEYREFLCRARWETWVTQSVLGNTGVPTYAIQRPLAETCLAAPRDSHVPRTRCDGDRWVGRDPLGLIDEGPIPGLLDSDSAFELAEAAGGAAARSATAARLESAALTTRTRGSEEPGAFRYGDDMTPDRLTLILNALSGHGLWAGAAALISDPAAIN